MDFTDAPIDPTSAQRLAAEGLRLDLVDTSDITAFSAWIDAETRGFYGDKPSEKRTAFVLEHAAYRRTTGVWDAAAPSASREPVATVSTWTTPLSLPGGSSIPVWAISAVTVAPTHRRRGVARNLLESELRTAQQCGVPIAALTASEATIYGRFGFAPSAFASDVTINTKRARWTGPAAPGRLSFTTLDDVHANGRAVFESARQRRAGDIAVDDALWAEVCGTDDREPDKTRSLRAVRYDVDGEIQGFVIYRVNGGDDDFSTHTVEVHALVTATDDAVNALWRFLLELDLVSEVKAYLRPVDEPVIWQVSDQRAVTSRHYDHLWLRILDPVATLEARSYSAPVSLVLDVADPQGFADGRMLLTTDESGAGSVELLDADDEGPADAGHLALSVNSLASLYLGGVTASSLQRAGRVIEKRAGSVDLADAAFRSPVAPLLSIWF